MPIHIPSSLKAAALALSTVLSANTLAAGSYVGVEGDAAVVLADYADHLSYYNLWNPYQNLAEYWADPDVEWVIDEIHEIYSGTVYATHYLELEYVPGATYYSFYVNGSWIGDSSSNEMVWLTYPYNEGYVEWVDGWAVLPDPFTSYSISGGDYLGDDNGAEIYAISEGSGDVTITLHVDPEDGAEVTWDGDGSSPSWLVRTINAIGAGTVKSVTAKVNNQNKATARVYIFPSPPSASDVSVWSTLIHDDSIATATEFGNLVKPLNTNEEYGMYYEAGKWKFTFDEFSFEAKWGMHAWDNQTDVPDPSQIDNPHNANWTPHDRATKAKWDLTPDSGGIAPRTKYWSSALTQAHEHFHYNDYAPRLVGFVRQAEAEIEGSGEWITATPQNIVNPESVKTSKLNHFHDKVLAKLIDLNDDYNPGKEARAYADGQSAYTALSGAIVVPPP